MADIQYAMAEIRRGKRRRKKERKKEEEELNHRAKNIMVCRIP